MLRVLRILLAALALAVLAAAGGGWWYLDASLPRAEARLDLSGLAAPAEVVLDAHGVPHVFAASARDAYFALGVVHARDRLWQMEFHRRLGAGRLAEILGPRALPADRWFRTLGVYRLAEAEFAGLSAAAQEALRAYAAGVNAWLAARDGPLPPEFLVTGHDPEAWRPADSLVLIKLMAFNLARSWRGEVLRAALSRRLGAERMAEFWPPYDGAPPPAASGLDGAAPAGLAALRPPAAGPGFGSPGFGSPGFGSNVWAVDGAGSETGKPLLANDLHLGFTTPSLWYLAHLEAPGLNVIGATLPGLPAVVVGRNGRVAWGMANTGADLVDLFVERPDPDDPERYLAPGGSRPFRVRDETIRVKGEDPVTLEVRETRHGPVVSGLLEERGAGLGEDTILALAWTALLGGDRTFQAGIEMAQAADWEDFVAAMRHFHALQQNVVYADVAGNIGYYVAGRVPVREAGDGGMPADGAGGTHDWSGVIPFEELPHALNPADGRIVRANNRSVPDGYAYLVAAEWEAPYRARRIVELLDRRPRHTVASFAAMQSDVVSRMAREMLPHMLRIRPRSEAGRRLHDRLAAWNGEMRADRPEPLIFAVWYRELTRLVYADELGPDFARAWRLRPLFIRRVLTEMPGWCDDVTTPETETCDDRLAAALERAAEYLDKTYGDDPADWRWGAAHVLDAAHRPFGALPVVGRLLNITLPAGGDNFTVNAGGYHVGDAEAPFADRHGPTYRAVYDLADLDRSVFVQNSGQSGHLLSSHYRDQSRLWAVGEYVPMTTRRAGIEAAAKGRLVLEPAR